jgi:hypothetical protein
MTDRLEWCGICGKGGFSYPLKEIPTQFSHGEAAGGILVCKSCDEIYNADRFAEVPEMLE